MGPSSRNHSIALHRLAARDAGNRAGYPGEMDELSEEQVIDRLLTLENDGLADMRAELAGERFLSLIQDSQTARAYVFRHGVDDTEGAEVPQETEFWEYPTLAEAQRVYRELLEEARQSGD